ncbi:MAG TPA: ATP-binding protein [Gemmatimonadaceae bacterium]|jgi:PAS domain S-box-containing protein
MPSSATPHTWLSRRLSTAQTLSLLTTIVVVAVLGAVLAITSITLSRSARAVAQDRMTRGVTQLAAVSATGIRSSTPRYARIASDPAIRQALSTTVTAGRDSAAVDTVLRRLTTPGDSGMPVELWRADGTRVAFVGNDIGDTISLHRPGEEHTLSPRFRPGLDSVTPYDSLQVGELYHADSRTYFWVVMPVVESGRPMGFILQQRRIASSPQTERTVRELTGDSVTGFYRNVDGTTWTTFGGVPAIPPIIASADSAVRTRPGAGRVMFAEDRVPGTPLVLSMEVPERSVLAGSEATVRRLALFGLLLTALGALLAWTAGRRVARPLVLLTNAARSVASGNYAARVPTVGSHEVASLAETFNGMAAEIGASRLDLERREEELRALADAIPQLAWMADNSGSIVWFNRRWSQYTGAESSDSFDARWSSAHDPAVVGDVMRRWHASVRSGEPFEMEARLRGERGDYRWFLTRVAPVRDRDGHVARWFGTSTDIQALREARDAAEAANRAKSDFLAAMSHELRTPLNAIGGYTELIEMGIRGPISDEQRRDLARIRTSQQHLLGLIGGVLDLARIESGRVQYQVENVAVAPVFEAVHGLVAPQAAAKQQTLDVVPCDPTLVVIADREKLRQILLNLLSNAVRHTPAASVITLTAALCNAAMVEILVCDNGPGIPVDMRESIFEPFVQLDRSLTQVKDGVGLGLAISRDLARGMAGDLAVAPTAQSGTCFSLVLPAGVFDETTNLATTMESPANTRRGLAARD